MSRFKKKVFLIMLMMSFLFPHTLISLNAEEAPMLLGTGLEAASIYEGTVIMVSIATTTAARYVYIEVDGQAQGVSYHSTRPDGNYLWVASIAPSYTQDVVIYANTTNSLQGAEQTTRTIAVTPRNIAIERIENAKEAFSRGEAVSVNIYTNNQVSVVWAMTAAGNYKRATLVGDEPSGARLFNILLPLNESQTIRISANTEYSSRGAITRDHNVVVVNPPAQITNLTANRTTIIAGDSVNFTITTNLEAAYVWTNINGTAMDATLQRTSANSRTWVLTASPTSTQDVVFYANEVRNELNASTRTQNIIVSAQSASITSASATRSNVSATPNQVTYTITAQTPVSVNFVWATVGTETVDLTSTTSGQVKTWIAHVQRSSTATPLTSIMVYAGTQNRVQENSRNVTVGSQGRIIRHDHDPQIGLNTSVLLVVNIETDVAVSGVAVALANTNFSIPAVSISPSSGSVVTWTAYVPLSVLLTHNVNLNNLVTFNIIALDQANQEIDRSNLDIYVSN